MFTRLAFTVYLIIIVTRLSFSDDRQNQFCIAPDTSLLISTIYHWCTPDGQNEYGHEWFYSYNRENRIVTRCHNYKGTSWSNTEFDLYVYGNEGGSLDKSTVAKSSIDENWSLRSRVTERRHDDVDTVVEDHGNNAFRYIYIKNSIGQVVEDIRQTREYNVWKDLLRTTYEYDSRGNKIYGNREDSEGELSSRTCYEYNRNNQLVSYRDQVVKNRVLVDQHKEVYKYDSRKRLVMHLILAIVDNVLDSAQKREYIYSNSMCNPITRTNEYEYWAASWHLIEQHIDHSNSAGLVTETQIYYYSTDSSIIRTKFKYEYDLYGNLILTNSFHQDTNGVWIKDYFETKSYLYVNSNDNQNHNSCNREWDGLSESDRFYSDPFNYDRQVAILDSKGKICQVKDLKLGSTGQELDSLKDITPEQLLKLRKSKDQRIFWRGNASMLMGVQNSH